jgi:hypothetical protein
MIASERETVAFSLSKPSRLPYVAVVVTRHH